jgi:hypothetical protein
MRRTGLLALGLALGLAGGAALAAETEGKAEIAPPGDCAVAKPHLAVLGSPGEPGGVPLLPGERCDFDCVAGNPSDRLTPTDVAAAPAAPSVGAPGKPSNPVQSGCLVGNCGPSPQRGPIGIVEPPAVIGLPPGIPGVPGGKTP